MSTQSDAVATATLGGGCFWCLEAVFLRVRGVRAVTPGYAGGSDPNPTYKAVCTGTTGHAEVIQVEYDRDSLTFRDLLEVFFAVHDPTTPNRQGADAGPQYRSIILYHDAGQRATAETAIEELEQRRAFDAPIVTELAPLEAFHAAEPYHHAYYDRNPGLPYCQAVIIPKLDHARRTLSHLYVDDGART